MVSGSVAVREQCVCVLNECIVGTDSGNIYFRYIAPVTDDTCHHNCCSSISISKSTHGLSRDLHFTISASWICEHLANLLIGINKLVVD